MSLQVIERYLTNNRCYQAGASREPHGIQIHSIGTARERQKVWLRIGTSHLWQPVSHMWWTQIFRERFCSFSRSGCVPGQMQDGETGS